MHHIYTTKAFVVHSGPHGEAGKFLLLFTKDFGMIGATAQGIRKIESKLRYHVQDACFSDVSIVRGKEVWRLTGAHELPCTKNSSLTLKILKLLKRLLHGEEKNEELFNIIETLYLTPISDDEFDIVETLTVFRILNTLGYIKNDEEVKVFLDNNSLDKDIINKFQNIKSKAIAMINNALKESQL